MQSITKNPVIIQAAQIIVSKMAEKIPANIQSEINNLEKVKNMKYTINTFGKVVDNVNK